MSFWAQTRLILRKDLRRLGWALLGYAAILLIGACLSMRDPWTVSTLDAASKTEPFLTPLAGLYAFVLVGLVVLLDPLVGTQPYWRTRPIRPAAMLSAKALFLVCFVALPPSLAEIAVLARFHVPTADWPAALWSSLAIQLPWLTPAAAIASVSTGVAPFLLYSIGALGLMFVGLQIVEQFRFFSGSDGQPEAIAISVAAVLVLWIQYRHHRRVLSFALLAAAFLLAPLTALIPRQPWPIRAGAETVDIPASISTISVDGRVNHYLSVDLAGAQPRSFFAIRRLVGSVTLEDGRKVPTPPGGSFGAPANHLYFLMASFPGYERVGPGVNSFDPLTSLNIPRELGPHSAPAAYEALAEIEEYRYERLCTLQARAGASFAAGPARYEVTKVSRYAGGVAVDIRTADAFELGRGLRHTNEILLVDPVRRRVLWPNWDHTENVPRQSYEHRVDLSRAGVYLLWEHLTRLFPLPEEAQPSDLSDLEIQVWRPVRFGATTGRIRTGSARQGPEDGG